MNIPKKYVWGFSQKTDGPMNFTAVDLPAMFARRKIFLEKNNLKSEKMVSITLTHSTNVKVVNESDEGKTLHGCDAIVTDTPGLILTVTGGDCASIYFFDKNGRAAGLAHAGWRGTVNGLVPNVIKSLVDNFSILPQDLIIHVGPFIQKCHFKIGADIKAEFSKYPSSIIDRDGETFVDLFQIILAQAKEAGVSVENISKTDECTHCLSEKYYSYRRDKPEIVEAMLAYLTIL